MMEKQQKLAKKIPAQIIFGLLSFLIALYIFGAVSHQIFHHNAQDLDVRVFQFLSGYTNETVIKWMQFLSFFGKPYFLLPAYVVLIIWYIRKKQKQLAVLIGIVGATSTLFSFGLKFLFQRQRPDIQLLDYLGGYSFPSGHAFLGFIFCSLLIFLVWRTELPNRWKYSAAVFLFLFSIAVGVSRIVLRVHYASDVIAGFALGYAWVLLFFWMQERRNPLNLPKGRL